ncbi:MAG: lipoyl(octanoyl) transferase LipB, partial [Candidatus Marinimicrobia bacterium]|nr:lipoyl(octanoyl) transferase LipB [Candidatus Neomarinimicrobiota bacterium]
MVKRLTSDKARKIVSVELGSVPFETALKIQLQLMNDKKNGMEEDYLLTVEHPHTYTIGVTGSLENLLVDEEYLNSNGIKLQHIRRGGDITYHGPGQLVAYPILNLNNYYKDLHRYLRDLEEVLISTVKHFGIVAGRKNRLTGIWVGEEKLASIGIKMSKWITMHGTALNVSTDLSYFDNIISCGVRD